MKKNLSIVAVLVFVLASCGSAKNVENNTKIYSASERTSQNNKAAEETPDQMTMNKNMPMNANGGVVGQTSGSTGAMNNVQANSTMNSSGTDYDQMYADLDMSDEQISTFRSAMEDFQTKRINMPNGEMLGSLESERERQLERILTTKQLNKYREWQANNKN